MQKVAMHNLKMLIGARDDVWDHIKDRVLHGEKIWIVTLNALMFMEFLKNPQYRYALLNSTFAIPDGIGVVKYIKKWGYETDRVPGIDTMIELCKWNGFSVFLLGGKEGIAEKAGWKLVEKFPEIKIVGYHHGYFSPEEEGKIVDMINSSKAEFLFVGMGIPKQEMFIFRNWKRLNIKLAMGVGGSFDVISGKTKRAPKFFQKMGLEWLFRMIENPRRFRQLPKLLNFYFKVYKSNNHEPVLVTKESEHQLDFVSISER